MNSVERIKMICKQRKMPLSRVEKDLGFANGYIGQLKKGTMPAERLASIAEYLGVPQNLLLYGEEKEKPIPENEDELNRIYEKKYYKLSDENRLLVDRLIEQLIKSQSGE